MQLESPNGAFDFLGVVWPNDERARFGGDFRALFHQFHQFHQFNSNAEEQIP
jgi:hypothetical protein